MCLRLAEGIGLQRYADRAGKPLDPDRIADLQWQLHEDFPRQKERPEAQL